MKKLLMALALLPLMAAAEDFNFEYTDNDDGTITLTGVSGTVPSTLKVPVQIEGKNVSAVGYGFMSKNQEISSIVISEGVRRIGEKAFCDCHSLESIEIPKSVKEDVSLVAKFISKSSDKKALKFSDATQKLATSAKSYTAMRS